MRIAVFAKGTVFHKNYGGLETLNKVLCEGLVSRGHEVCVFSPKLDVPQEELTENGVRYIFVPCKYKMGMVLGFFGRLDKNNWVNKSYDYLLRSHTKNKFDIVVGQSSAAIGIISRKNSLGLKVVSIAHGSILSEYKTYLKDLSLSNASPAMLKSFVFNTGFVLKNFFFKQREFILNSNKVVTVSNYVKKVLMDETFAPEDKFEIIFNGMDARAFDSFARSLEGEVTLVFVGRVIRAKGVYDLLNIMSDTRFKNVKLSIIGDGEDLEDFKSKFIKNKIDNVSFFGWLQPEPVISKLFESDVFVLPTKRIEGFPMTLVEAMFAQLPIVAYNLGGVSDAIIEGETGFLVNPGNIEDFKLKLLKLIEDRNLRLEFGKKASERAKKEFELTTMLDKYEKVFREVLG